MPEVGFGVSAGPERANRPVGRGRNRGDGDYGGAAVRVLGLGWPGHSAGGASVERRPGRKTRLDVYFPIADATVSPLLLALLGVVVGTMTGFFWSGRRLSYHRRAAGAGRTDDIRGRHRAADGDGNGDYQHAATPRLGNVDMRLAVLIVCGTIPGFFWASGLTPLWPRRGLPGRWWARCISCCC